MPKKKKKQLFLHIIISQQYNNIKVWFNINGLRLNFLGSYFLCIGISYKKTHFTSNWADLSGFKIIMTSGFIEDIKIAQELLKKSWICKSRYLLDTCRAIEI